MGKIHADIGKGRVSPKYITNRRFWAIRLPGRRVRGAWGRGRLAVDPARVLSSPRTVLVVGVFVLVLDPQALSGLDEGTLVGQGQGAPVVAWNRKRAVIKLLLCICN